MINCILNWLRKPTLPDNILPISEVITESEDAADIHITWAEYVNEHPEYRETMGDEAWHMHWADVHLSAAWHLRRK